MRFGRLLETQGGFASVTTLRMTTGQQLRFGDPDAVFILTNLHFRERNNHSGCKLTCFPLFCEKFLGRMVFLNKV
jgi:hypothetical protein